MKKYFIVILFLIFTFSSFSQIGISSPSFIGSNSKLMKTNWSAELQFFIPVGIPIKIKDSTKTIILFQPAIKWNWYNFENNLIVDRQNSNTNFTPDPDINNIYSNKFLKTSSQMQTTNFYLPVNIYLYSKKIKYLRIAPGFYIEYLIGGKFTRNFNNGTKQSITNKFRDDADYYDFQRFQYGVCGHVSYKFFTIYGVYSLTTLFKPSQNIDIRKYSVGIWFNFFWKKRMLKPY